MLFQVLLIFIGVVHSHNTTQKDIGEIPYENPGIRVASPISPKSQHDYGDIPYEKGNWKGEDYGNIPYEASAVVLKSQVDVDYGNIPYEKDLGKTTRLENDSLNIPGILQNILGGRVVPGFEKTTMEAQDTAASAPGIPPLETITEIEVINITDTFKPRAIDDDDDGYKEPGTIDDWWCKGDKCSRCTDLKGYRVYCLNGTTTKAPTDLHRVIKLLVNICDIYWSNGDMLYQSNFEKQVRQAYPNSWWPDCPSTTSTKATPSPTDAPSKLTGRLIAKCFVCGMYAPGIPYEDFACADTFLSQSYKKHCKYLNRDGWFVNGTNEFYMWGRWTGGCALRFVDISPIYHQRTCRNNDIPAVGASFASRRLARLEYSLRRTNEYGRAPLVQLNDGRMMPMLALGTWLVANATNRETIKEVESSVIWALEAGYRHIDTAWAYQVEDQVGSAVRIAAASFDDLHKVTTTPALCGYECYMNKLKDTVFRGTLDVPPVRREDVFLTTKLWNDAHARAAVVPALKKSLKQLQLNYVDLYLIHWPLGQFANSTFDYTPYTETWRGMMDAQALNLTRSIGVCNFNERMLETLRTHQLPTPAVLQIEWNLNLQQPSLLAYCRRRNITVSGYMPLGSLLPDRVARDAPPPRVDDPVLQAMADKYNKTVPQIVLRYAVEMGVTPVQRATTPDQIVEYLLLFDFELDEDDRRTLRAFDRGYRTVPALKYQDHPYFPFEKTPLATTEGSTLTTVNMTEQAVTIGDLNDNSARIHFRDVKT